MMNVRIASGLFLLMTMAGGCGGEPFGIVTETPSVPIAELLGSPEYIPVGDTLLHGTAELYRDFSYTPDPPNHRLRAFVRIGHQGHALPSGFRITRLWVVHDGEVWETTRFEDHRSNWPVWIQVYAKNGPEWEIGAVVDVVVRVKGVRGGPLLLRIPAVHIGKTE